jgi:hypothetical protein
MYTVICKELLMSGKQFGHLAMVLSWNLLARVGNVMAILLKHMDWHGDHLRVFFAHMKTDQEGNTSRYPRAVYANPLKPSVCPVLALALYFLTFPCVDDQLKLFEGGNQYNHFLSQLRKVLKRPEVQALLKEAGISAENIAAHSSRKGGASYIMSGTTGGPTISATSLRAGWSMPNVQDTYIRFAEAGDEFVGRTLSGLPLSSQDFALLPPHFVAQNEAVARALKLCFPTHPEKYDGVLAMCLASLVYHRDFLREILSEDHPARSSPLFIVPGLMDSLVPLVRSGLDGPGSVMHATGVSPMTIVLRTMEKNTDNCKELASKIDAIVPSMMEGMQSVLEKNAIESGTVTRAGLKDMLMGVIHESGLLLLRDSLSGNGPASNAVREQQAQAPSSSVVGQLHQWNGKLHRVPQSFKLPAGTPEHCFNLWLIGDVEHGYPPLRYLEPNDMPSANARKRLSDLKFLMSALQEELVQRGRWVDSPSPEEVAQMFFVARRILPCDHTTPVGRTRRTNQLSWKTVANLLRKRSRPVYSGAKARESDFVLEWTRSRCLQRNVDGDEDDGDIDEDDDEDEDEDDCGGVDDLGSGDDYVDGAKQKKVKTFQCHSPFSLITRKQLPSKKRNVVQAEIDEVSPLEKPASDRSPDGDVHDAYTKLVKYSADTLHLYEHAPVIGDGACMFRLAEIQLRMVIADFDKRFEGEHVQVHQRIRYLCARWVYQTYQGADDQVLRSIGYNGWEDWHDKMVHDTHYGDELCLEAISALFEVRICVIFSGFGNGGVHHRYLGNPAHPLVHFGIVGDHHCYSFAPFGNVKQRRLSGHE